MSVLVVDWLGRGGIAQTAQIWRDEARQAGFTADLVSRARREVRPDVGFHSPIDHRIAHHLTGIVTALRTIRSSRPDVVVLHSWLIPVIELPVVKAAHAVGAKVILVAHNHVSHTRSSGLDVGLDLVFREADLIVTHSDFVRTALSGEFRSKTRMIPHPRFLAELESSSVTEERENLCLQFGVARSTKDTELIIDLAGRLGDEWRFLAAGTMANEIQSGLVETVPGFVEPEALADLVSRSAAVIIPYEKASQSGAVVMARCLGAIPIASAVGGIPEQIADGVDGILIESGAGPERWAAALERVSDPESREAMRSAGRVRMDSEHRQFSESIQQLLTTNGSAS